MKRGVVVVVSIGVACGLSLGFASQRSAGSAGQVAFVPGRTQAVTSAVQGSASSNLGTWALAIGECAEGPEGLKVNGRVDGPAGGAVTVVVSGGDPEGPGVRTGRDFAAHARPDEALPGDFRVVLPWATMRSTFSLVGDRGDSGVPLGCP